MYDHEGVRLSSQGEANRPSDMRLAPLMTLCPDETHLTVSPASIVLDATLHACPRGTEQLKSH